MLQSENSLLLVIDIQGKLAELMYNRDRFLDRVKRLISGAAILDIPVVVTEQRPEKIGRTRPEIAEMLEHATVFEKSSFSCLGAGDCRNFLINSSRRDIVVAGIEAHVCVYQTVVDLVDAAFNAHVVADAVSSRSAVDQEVAMARMQQAGAQIATTEMVLFEMLRTGEGETFRRMLKVLR